jgi:hypothetical protein
VEETGGWARHVTAASEAPAVRSDHLRARVARFLAEVRAA